MDLNLGHGFIPRIGEENYKAIVHPASAAGRPSSPAPTAAE